MPSFQTFYIKEPIWNGRNGREAVGLDVSKLADTNQVIIEYVNKDGERLFPYPFYINGTTALKHTRKTTKSVELVVVPLDEFIIMPDFEE